MMRVVLQVGKAGTLIVFFAAIVWVTIIVVACEAWRRK